MWQRRVTMVGHDGSNHQFKVQNPAGRNSRREERVIQLFRIMNAVLEKKKDSRQRNLQFHLPTIVPLAPNVRLVQDDASYVSLHDIMDDHCKRMRYHRDEPLLHYTRTMKAAIAHKKEGFVEGSAAFKALCMEAAAEVGTAVIPDTVLTKVGRVATAINASALTSLQPLPHLVHVTNNEHLFRLLDGAQAVQCTNGAHIVPDARHEHWSSPTSQTAHFAADWQHPDDGTFAMYDKWGGGMSVNIRS